MKYVREEVDSKRGNRSKTWVEIEDWVIATAILVAALVLLALFGKLAAIVMLIELAEAIF